MRFLHGKVKARKGQKISVTFSAPTRVLVMTQRNFEKYKNNLTFTYYGGQKEDSPYEFSVPQYGDWYVVVEKGSYHAPEDITASIELISEAPVQQLPPAEENGEMDAIEEEESVEEDDSDE